MCKIKVFLSALVFGALMLAAAVCGAGPSTAVTEDPAATVAQAYQKLANLENCHVTAYVLATVAYKEQTVNATINSEIDCRLKPMLCQSTTTISADIPSKKFTQQSVQYMEEAEDRCNVYSQINGKWVKQSLPHWSAGPFTAYHKYADAIKRVAKVRETAAADIFEVVIDANGIQKDMERHWTSMGLPASFATGILKDLGEIKYFVTIDKATAAISVIDFNLSPLMVKLGDNAATCFNMSANQKAIVKAILGNMKLFVRITLSQFDGVEPIVIPEEARNASEKTSPELPAAVL